MDAYSLSVQDFFIKPVNFRDISETIRKIVEYWQECFSPESIYRLVWSSVLAQSTQHTFDQQLVSG